MAFQTVFKRYELKYLLTKEEKDKILSAILPYMQLDDYGLTTIRNLYFDTDSYQLIRRSLEGPVYKEKLRLRSYTKATDDSIVFAELKKKYDSVVYKRRLGLREADAVSWLSGNGMPLLDSQISREIDYFIHFYDRLTPKAFLSYEREAYYTKEASNFRLTFDQHILFRDEALSLKEDVWGSPVIDEGMVLMEIKTSCGMPLWMVSALSENGIRKRSFSKYGAAYRTYIYPKINKNKMFKGVCIS